MALSALRASPAGGSLVFDDEFLRKLEQLQLLARKIFRGVLRGEHTTARRGRGLEFSDFRHYRPGDDFRHIDWNIYSRLDQLFLKLHASEDDVTLHLILDTSASMGFGEPSKFDQARRLAAALAYIALHNLDRVGVNAFSEGLGAALPPIKTRHHMARLLTFLGELPCSGVTRFDSALRAFATRTRNPGLVILISDLLDHRWSDPPLDGALRLVDAETGDELEVTVDEDLRRLYQHRLERHLLDVERFCRQRSVEYLRASSAIAFEDVVLKYLRQGVHLR